MSASDRPPDASEVTELLHRTFDAQPAEPLDPAIIQLMLELSRAPDAARADATVASALHRKTPLRAFAARLRRGRHQE